MTKMDQVFIIQLRSDRLGNASTTAKTRTICSSLPSLSSSSLSSAAKTAAAAATTTATRTTTTTTTSSSSPCTVNAHVKRQPNPKKSISWMALIWLAAVLPSSLKYHAYGLDELHIGGIFPIGGKGGWVSSQMTVLYEIVIVQDRQKKENNNSKYSLLLWLFHLCECVMKQGGLACLPAAELALEDVNSKSDLLPGFKLTLYSNDSEVCTTNCVFLSSFSSFLFLLRMSNTRYSHTHTNMQTRKHTHTHTLIIYFIAFAWHNNSSISFWHFVTMWNNKEDNERTNERKKKTAERKHC